MANPWYILLALINSVTFICTLDREMGHKYMGFGISIKRLPLVPMVLVGMAVNNITPSARGGGEPIRHIYLVNILNVPWKTFLPQ